jgi:glycosyltransferase involved in cell wall biosynthesis
MSLVNLDPWLTDADWVYAPVEQPVTTRRKLAVTVHDLYAFEPIIPGIPHKERAGLSWHRRMKRILDRANLIATVSAFTKSRMLELFEIRHPERIVVIGNGGSEGFSPEPGLEDERILRRFGLRPFGYVLFPASLTRRKGGDLLLEIAHVARDQQAGLYFVVIGRRHDDDLLTNLRNMRERMADFPVALLGYVMRSELAALYRHARAALFPSRYEGFGIPIVEAMTSGCPLFISGQAALLEVAEGNAAVIQADPATVLAALNGNAPRTQSVQGTGERTWSRCAARLVQAMK